MLNDCTARSTELDPVDGSGIIPHSQNVDIPVRVRRRFRPKPQTALDDNATGLFLSGGVREDNGES